MKRIIAFLLLAVMMLGLCSCSTFEDTPETDAAFAAYEAALKQTVSRNSGSVSVETVNKDTLAATESVGIIEYSFVTNEERRVSFERNDYTNGELVASYYGDGSKAYQMDLTTDQWVDVTADSAAMLVHETNYMNTLSLFRVDNNFRYSKRYLESLKMEDTEDGGKVVIFTLKSSALNEMFAYLDARKLKREMTHQTRSYYIDPQGDLFKIVIDSSQNVSLDGKEGVLSNVINVLVDFQ